jgi:hypothetical protein
MGLNIHIIDMNDRDRNGYPQDVIWWDSIRHTGDTKFWFDGDFDWVEEPGDDEWRKRPADLDAAIRWVSDNIEPGANKMRLIEALKCMKEDPDLWMVGYM